MRKFRIYRADIGYKVRRKTLGSVEQTLQWAEDNLYNWTGPDHKEAVKEFVRKDDLRPGMDHEISDGCYIVCVNTE